MDQITQVIPLDENHDSELLKLRNEGWSLTPGVKPYVTYSLSRAPQYGGVAHVKIDEAGVFIIPAQK